MPSGSSNGGGRHLLLLIAILDVLSAKVGIGSGHDHQAFIQSESELRYLVDDGVDVPFISEQTISNENLQVPVEGSNTPSPSSNVENGEGIKVLRSPIKFDPPELNFDEQPIGLPVMRKVRVFNLNTQSSIQMLSISGNTIHFHCSFFTDKVIPPSGNTTFDVVFLGRDEGPVENTLYIHTSAGSFRFNVKAQGTPNPYRLRPLVGVKLPVNSSFSPLIQLHNPHPEPIQVLEMYSSGGDLHLELPNGETEGSETFWQIPPYQTKPVMKANFVARGINNHTAYIRIKTNTTGAEFLYLPLEVEVTSQPGIYSPQDMIDFGLVPADSPPQSVKVLVLNSGTKAIQIQNVISTPVNEAVQVNFKPTKVQPASETLRPKVVADLMFNPGAVKEEGLQEGKIVIKSKNSQFKVGIPYRALVLKGQLMVNSTVTNFHLTGEKKTSIQRNLSVTNGFAVPVAVHNLSLALEASKFFDLEPNKGSEKATFSPVILQPGETKDLTVLSLKDEAWEDRILNSHLTIQTNVSDIDVPLLCFHGVLNTFFPGSPSQEILDFGTLGMNEKRDLYFAILNKNPIGITLKTWDASLSGSAVEVVGVDKGNETDIVDRGSFSGMTRNTFVKPGHYLIFRLGLHTTDQEGAYEGNVNVETSYHNFNVPYTFRVARGSLQTLPKELIFEPVFPGTKAELKLKVFSSFAEEMITETVAPVPPDPRFSFKSTVNNGRNVIMSGERSLIGKVIFDPAATCRQDNSCYAGFDLQSSMGIEWEKGFYLPQTIHEIDYTVVKTLFNRLREVSSPSPSFNITLNLDTNKVRGFLVRARAKLIWPRVLPPTDQLTFPLTQVGNYTTKEVSFLNPSDQTIICHLVPMVSYPEGIKLASMLPVTYKRGGNPGVGLDTPYSNETHFRILSVHESSTENPNLGPIPGYHGDLIQADTKSFLLKAGVKAVVKIIFEPQAVGHFKSGLFVRNNLTGVEFIEFFGEAVHGEVKFGKFKATPASTSETLEKAVLEFDMKEKHLKGCTSPTNKDQTRKSDNQQPMFTVKRTFKAKNTGMTSFYVKGFEIEGYACEGYGFRVLNCEAFNLEPNETREIHIAFTPDFTLSRISRMMTMKTTLKHLEAVNYTLVATVPSQMLNTCSRVLPRPFWEVYLFWACNITMAIVVIIAVCTAGYEADRLLNAAFLAPFLQIDDQGQLLDLRSVADMVHRELNNENHANNGPATPNAVRIRSSTPQAQIQELKNLNRRSAMAQQPHVVWRVFNSIRGCFRAIGIKMWHLIWNIPNLFPRLPRSAAVEEVPSEDNNNDDEDDADDEQDVTRKDQIVNPVQVQGAQGSQHPQSQKKNGKRNQKLSRKKSLTNDPDESSSTTTESSTVEELEQPVISKPLEPKKNKKQHKVPAATPIIPTEPMVSSGGNQAKKKAKKQNSVEKKVSPERPSASSATSTNAEAKKAKNNKENKKGQAEVNQPMMMQNQGQTPVQVQQPQLSQVQPRLISPPASNSVTIQQQQKKVTPVGKIRPEIKKTENLGAQFGPVGAKPVLWPQNDSNGFPTLNKNGPGMPPMEPENNHRNGQGGHGFNPNSNSNGNSPSRGLVSGLMAPTLMAQFQMNRRQETAHFVQNIAHDWPGFNNEGSVVNQDFVKNLWDQETPLRPAPQDRWGSGANVWGDSNARNPSGYVGGLSVLGGQNQVHPQNQHQQHFEQQHGGSGDLLSALHYSPPPPTASPQTPTQVQVQTVTEADLGLNSIGSLASIWSSAPNQPPPQSPTSVLHRDCHVNTSTSDELNQYHHQQQQVMQQQQNNTSSNNPQQQPPPRMNNSWSTTLFRNK